MRQCRNGGVCGSGMSGICGSGDAVVATTLATPGLTTFPTAALATTALTIAVVSSAVAATAATFVIRSVMCMHAYLRTAEHAPLGHRHGGALQALGPHVRELGTVRLE